ncbi:MAG: sensor histidine kinase [Ignavibacteriales bacterium]|nr:sensor histidine kinase [Ignavibacteriales bacterium]
MNNLENYTNQFFTFQNPFFFAVIMSIVVLSVTILIFIKVIFPLQKKFVLENQRYLLEKAELMALFAEMDPDPLIRIDLSGTIIQTNEASRRLFPGIDYKEKKINEVLPLFSELSKNKTYPSIEKINDVIFSVIVKKYDKLKFSNIYLHDITQVKKYEFELENYKNRLKSLANRLDSEYEELKKTLSRELHDDIGQQLVMINMKLAQSGNYKHEELLSDIATVYEKIREISRTLKPIELNNLGLKLSVQSLIHNVTTNSQITGDLEFEGNDHGLNHDVVFCIYRIIQEAINNIIKHSQANEFSIHIEILEQTINMVISDNGVGIPAEYYSNNHNHLGVGLISIQERTEKLKGTFKIDSSPSEGTTLLIQIPKEGI